MARKVTTPQLRAIAGLTSKLGQTVYRQAKADLGLADIATVEMTAAQAYQLVGRLKALADQLDQRELNFVLDIYGGRNDER